ncbi:diguanylate cyclase (GGDEF)-like protein [Halospina denitrificans]|uniref:diguanylate cyclase n=1 Tax=Halospina denitrificans TaxID=332522 RepID=A0A4R7K1I2_9GAMM|nr:diguanylate cyclase [Halospina denitrificans]TDT43339.1 diguanylate cyclase (GGDEF)-like protein [Halospina denitrificans]
MRLSEQDHYYSAGVQRITLLRALLILTMVFAAGFGVLNLYRGLLILGAVELGVAFLSGILMLILQGSRYPQYWGLFYLILFFAMLITALVTAGNSRTVFVWILIIPIIAHFLHGRQLGLLLSLAFLASAWAVYYLNFLDLTLLGFTDMANVVASSVVLTGLIHVYEYSREKAEDRLGKLAATDSLTGLPNRKRLREVLDRTLSEAERTGAGFCLLGMDLDHFKNVNDQYGHDAGDQALRQVSDLLRTRLRRTDTAARWGGEEFFVLLPGTSSKGALQIAEAVRADLAETPIRVGGERLKVTVSIGISEYPADGREVRELLVCADRRLYEAKSRGRDLVVNEGGPGIGKGVTGPA